MDSPHDIWQGHLMRFAGILHDLSSLDLHDPTNLFAVQTTVRQINETVDLLTSVGHTPPERIAAETTNGVLIHR